jgi:hypothetical protein
MKRLGKILFLTALLAATLFTGCRERYIALAAFYDSADGLGVLYRIDQEGQLYFLDFDTGEWEPDGSPCPGTPPYDLDGWHDPDDDTWDVVAVDGEGVLWHSTDAWYRITEPLGAKGRYVVAGFYDYALGEDIINVMDPDGQLHHYVGEGWDEIGDPCPGEGPYDLVVFYDFNDDLYWSSMLDGSGRNFDLITGEWVQDGTAIEEGPCHISGFHDIVDDAYLIYVIDNGGNLYEWIGDDWEKVGPTCPGAAPFDIDAFYDPDGDSYYVLVLESGGTVYQFTGEGWSPQN